MRAIARAQARLRRILLRRSIFSRGLYFEIVILPGLYRDVELAHTIALSPRHFAMPLAESYAAGQHGHLIATLITLPIR